MQKQTNTSTPVDQKLLKAFHAVVVDKKLVIQEGSAALPSYVNEWLIRRFFQQIPSLDIHDAHVDDSIVEQHTMLLSGGVWGQEGYFTKRNWRPGQWKSAWISSSRSKSVHLTLTFS